MSSGIIDKTFAERKSFIGSEDKVAKLQSVKKKQGKIQASFTTPSTKKDKTYIMTIQFQDADKLSRWNFKSKDIKVNCTCPHYHWGGISYSLGTELDASIRTTKIPDTYWRSKHGQPTVCKHLLGLLKNLSSFKKPIFNELKKIK